MSDLARFDIRASCFLCRTGLHGDCRGACSCANADHPFAAEAERMVADQDAAFEEEIKQHKEAQQ